MEWKSNYKCAVLLTFDIDGRHMWLAKHKRGFDRFDKLTHLSSGDYGVNVGVPRLLDLLENFQIETGFFVPGLIAEENPDLIKQVHEAGHEIGNHSYSHIPPTELSANEQLEEITKTQSILEELTGDRPIGYRAPIADISEKTIEILYEEGYLYESSLRSYDVPYYLDDSGESIVELPLYWTGDDAVFFGFSAPETLSYTGISQPSKVFEIWEKEFTYCYDNGLLMVLACHPQIIARPNRILMLEEFIDQYLTRSDVWVTKPKNVARYFERLH